MSADNDYNPNSSSAMFSKILERLDSQDRTDVDYRFGMIARMDKIQASVDKTNGRVTKLEEGQWYQRGFVSAISLGVSALWHLLIK
jgi:hypothetical protein